eukprot:jgi/Tetstr1/431301/TSEL_020994.t1
MPPCTMCPGRFRDPGAQLVGANGPPLPLRLGRLRSQRTQLVGANGPLLHLCPGLLRDYLRTQLTGHAAAGWRYRVATAFCAPAAFTAWARSKSAPTGRRSALCPGRFRSPGTQSVGANEP